MAGDRFVVQEHHARALHWDFRLERDGVLVSWAVPKGLPDDPKRNRLAVHVDDHALEHAHFEDPIGSGPHGAGRVTIWDEGTYVTEKWGDDEVKVVLHGRRTEGRFVLFRTGGKNWMMHRMDGPPRSDWEPEPTDISPMLATPGPLPVGDQWGFEMKWDGVRAIVHVDGGRLRIMSRNDNDVTVSYPELRALGAQLGTTNAVLDGEIVADQDGRPSFARLQRRMHVANAAQARKLAESDPVTLMIFDLLYLDGRSMLALPYRTRREFLDGLDLHGPSWQTPPPFTADGAEAVEVTRRQGLEGVVAKRLTSTYLPGKRSGDWVKVKNLRTQEVVVAGWKPGQGRRVDSIGSLLLGVPTPDGLSYVGKVGTGFTDRMLTDLHTRLAPTRRVDSPFAAQLPRPDARDAQWVEPELVGEVAFSEWTPERRLRHPVWRGLRPDKDLGDVVFES